MTGSPASDPPANPVRFHLPADSGSNSPMSSNTQPKVVLITGCSGGIGRATADLLMHRGHTVCATARRKESVDQLAAAVSGESIARRLDVTDVDSIRTVVDEMLERFGRIDAVINNAGFGQIGAVEDVSLDRWQTQINTNLIGVVAVCQAVLPAMRQRGSGTIVNVSSIVAHVAMPLMSAYCASKHALDALNTALRIETAGFGVRVVTIEPGPISTGFQSAAEKTAGAIPTAADSPYAKHYSAFEQSWTGSYRKGVKPPDAVAKVIARAVESNRPRRRYRVGLIGKAAPLLIGMTPDFLFDWITRGLLNRGKDTTDRLGKTTTAKEPESIDPL